MTTLTGQQVADARLAGWTYLGDALRTRVLTGDFATGLALVEAVGEVAEQAQHHPDIDLRYGHVDVLLVSHDAGGVTARDVAMARTVSELAARMGAELDGPALQRVELALDTPDHAAVRPFWRALLAYEGGDGAEDDLHEPSGTTPPVWFQESGSDEPRQRWHLDVWVDPSRAGERIEAAVAAGGAVVDGEAAPSFWVLADAEGNRSCLCTWQDRGTPPAAADGPSA